MEVWCRGLCEKAGVDMNKTSWRNYCIFRLHSAGYLADDESLLLEWDNKSPVSFQKLVEPLRPVLPNELLLLLKKPHHL